MEKQNEYGNKMNMETIKHMSQSRNDTSKRCHLVFDSFHRT